MYKYKYARTLSCCPTFLIAQAGNVLIIWGAVLADRFFVEQLAQVYLGPRQCGGEGGRSGLEEAIFEVAKVLRVLAEGLADLRKHYERFKPTPTPPRSSTVVTRSSTRASAGTPRSASVGPPRSQFPYWDTFESSSSGVKKTYTIKYERRITTFFSKAVFRATMTSDSEANPVVVKFAYRYCKEAHELLAGRGLAPKLHYASYVGADSNGPGMWLVVMDFIEGDPFVLENTSPVQKDKLENAVAILHLGGFVHGDLREPNILVRKKEAEDDLYLLDFDWCGKEGMKNVTYPADICMDDDMNWPKGVGPNLPIKREHDLYRKNFLLGGNV